MGMIIKLDTTFSNTDLPKLGDYGQLFNDGLTGLYKLNDAQAYLQDDSGNNNDMTYAGNAGADAAKPVFSNAIYSLPDPISSGLYHKVDLGSSFEDQAYTFVAAYRRLTSRGFWFIRNGALDSGANIFLNQSLQLYSLGLGKTVNIGPVIEQNKWSIVIISVDSDGVSVSVNGSNPDRLNFADNGGAPTPQTRTFHLGTADPNQGFQGDLSFAAMYDRSLSHGEMASTYLGVKNFLISKKGIAV